MTLFELVADAVTQRNFERLGRLLIDTGGKLIGVRFGAATDAWPGGSDTSSGVVVSHGLGKTPVAVFTQSSTIVAHARPTSIGASTFNINLRTIDASTPGAGNVTVYWLAIG